MPYPFYGSKGNFQHFNDFQLESKSEVPLKGNLLIIQAICCQKAKCCKWQKVYWYIKKIFYSHFVNFKFSFQFDFLIKVHYCMEGLIIPFMKNRRMSLEETESKQLHDSNFASRPARMKTSKTKETFRNLANY